MADGLTNSDIINVQQLELFTQRADAALDSSQAQTIVLQDTNANVINNVAAIQNNTDAIVSVSPISNTVIMAQTQTINVQDERLTVLEQRGALSVAANVSSIANLSNATKRFAAMNAANNAMQYNARSASNISVALGLGQYDSETAVAAGLTTQLSGKSLMRLSASKTKHSETKIMLGISVSW